MTGMLIHRREKALALLRAAASLLVAAILLAAPARGFARQAYVANAGDGTVSVIDAGSGAPVGAPIPVGAGPLYVAFTPDGSRAFVPNSGAGSVSVIDTGTRTVIKTLTGLGSNPRRVAVSPDGRRAYVVYENSDYVTVIDVASSEVVATIPAVGETGSLAVTPDGKRLYVTTDTIFDHVAVIDTQANLVSGVVGGVGSRPAGIAFKPDGSRAYVANWDSGTVSVVNPATDQIEHPPILAGTNPFEVAVSPDGGRAFVTNFAEGTVSGSVSAIDTATRSASTYLGAGANPAGLAFAPDGRRVYVTNASAPTLTALAATTGAVEAVLGTGPQPMAVALVPDQPPNASLQVGAGATAGSPVALEAGASRDPDGTIARYDWDFGDGATLANGGPAPTHTYATPGTYRATVTLTDDEGCSVTLVYTGQSTLCNGSAVARTSVDVVVADPCASAAPQSRPSVTHWKRVPERLRVRLRGEPGSQLRGAATAARFSLEVRGIRGERDRRLASVSFYLDGDHLRTDRHAPYSLKINPVQAGAGEHTLIARVAPRAGDRRSLRLPFAVSPCEAAAFSVSLSSKRPGAHPNLDLRARAGSGELSSVKFKLPSRLRLATGGLAGKAVGAVKLLDGSRTRKLLTLTLEREPGGGVELAANTKLDVQLSQTGKRPALSLKGLAAYGAREARLAIYGKRTLMLRNPDSCSPSLRFRATVVSAGGGETALARTLKMCTAPR